MEKQLNLSLLLFRTASPPPPPPQWALSLCTIRSHGTKLHMLVSKLRVGLLKQCSSPGPAFVLEVSQRNLLTSICSFVPCDRAMGPLEISSQVTVCHRWRHNNRLSFQLINQPSNVLLYTFPLCYYLSIFQLPLCNLSGDMHQGPIKERELRRNLEKAVIESFSEIDNFCR